MECQPHHNTQSNFNLFPFIQTPPSPPQLRLLLAAGLEAATRDEDGRTAAEAALMNGHLKAFEVLSSNSKAAAPLVAPPNPAEAPTAAVAAAQQVVEGEDGLLENGEGAPVKTPLHAAAECGSVAAVRRCVFKGVGVWVCGWVGGCLSESRGSLF